MVPTVGLGQVDKELYISFTSSLPSFPSFPVLWTLPDSASAGGSIYRRLAVRYHRAYELVSSPSPNCAPPPSPSKRSKPALASREHFQGQGSWELMSGTIPTVPTPRGDGNDGFDLARLAAKLSPILRTTDRIGQRSSPTIPPLASAHIVSSHASGARAGSDAMFARAVGVTSIIASVVITHLLSSHTYYYSVTSALGIGAGTVVSDHVAMCH
jgi:hypothetical protein